MPTENAFDLANTHRTIFFDISDQLGAGNGGAPVRALSTTGEIVSDRYWKGVLWTPSYFAANCGGAPLEVVTQYLEDLRKL